MVGHRINGQPSRGRPDKADEAFHHIRDGYVFPKNVGHAFQTGEINAVPFMTGYNADEATLFFPDDPEPSVWIEGLPREEAEKQLEMLDAAYPGQGAKLQNLYGLAEDFEAGGEAMMGDDIFGVNIRLAAESNEATGQPSFAYFFNRLPPSDKQTVGAYHTAEIPFVFNSIEPALGNSEADVVLADVMGTYWTNFAKSSNPNTPITPEIAWPVYAGQNWMVLSANTGAPIAEVQADMRKDKLDALETGLELKLQDLETALNP